MGLTVIAADLVFSILKRAVTVEMKVVPSVWIFMYILQRRQNLKGGAWRIESLSGPVYKLGLCVLRRGQLCPLFIYRIGVEIG